MKCIPIGWRCDGHPDCADNSDEKNCDGNSTKLQKIIKNCTVEEFECAPGECIKWKAVCDSYAICSNKADELHCNETSSELQFNPCAGDNGKCEQLCKWLPANPNPVCGCFKGYRLDESGRKCNGIKNFPGIFTEFA